MDMDRRLLTVLALSAVLVSGCDWIRARLDMPTSDDIARKRELIARKEADQKAAVASSDSLVPADSTVRIAVPEPETSQTGIQKPEPSASGLNLTPRSNLDKTYYIIVGAFRTDQLVARSLKDNEGILEAPFAFEGNGLKYVAIGGYDTLEDARKALYTAHQKAPEAWVYKKK